jgi:hypothetical protein
LVLGITAAVAVGGKSVVEQEEGIERKGAESRRRTLLLLWVKGLSCCHCLLLLWEYKGVMC